MLEVKEFIVMWVCITIIVCSIVAATFFYNVIVKIKAFENGYEETTVIGNNNPVWKRVKK